MDTDERVQAASDRLRVLEALTTAVERREDLLRLVGTSATSEEAAAPLQSEWGLSEQQAVGVLDLQMRRFSVRQRDRIVEERASLEQRIAELSP